MKKKKIFSDQPMLQVKQRVSDSLLAKVIERNSFGVVITDTEGTIEYVNSRQCQQSGYLLEELVGRNARIFQSGETSKTVYESMWTTILAGKSWCGELLNRRKDGELYWEFIHISPVLGEEGNILHFFTIKEENLSPYKSEDSIESANFFDPLTGLLNRMAFHNRLEQIIKNSTHVSGSGGLLVLHIDIDRFDSFNQVLGHVTADRLLVEIALRIRHFIRREDELARIGGDEFGVLMSQSGDKETQMSIIQRILARIRQPIFFDQREMIVTASIGVASYPLDGREAQNLLNNAHTAMTIAKQRGGDMICRYKPVKKKVTAEQLDMSTKLRHAIDRGELLLHYQPQVSLISGEIVGLEALIRWNRPGFGLISPGVFIPVAEENGLIIPIGRWVLREAISQIVAWRQSELPPIKVAVNLSATHFHNDNLPEFVDELLKENDVFPDQLELELTESAMMSDVARVKNILERLKKVGVHISLDDFGTGHSSLAYLSHFPFDLLKIDQIFVRDVTTNPINASIVAATIAMAHNLGKSVIAEGVETEGQMLFLRRHDCDLIQGYLLSQPRPAVEITTMVQQSHRWCFDNAAKELPTWTLLLVDDEPYILSGLTRVFRREGYRLLTAKSGPEALELLAVNEVHVIISDQRMPNMTGIELLRRVKELYPETTRIILSAYSDQLTITEAINQGAIWKYFTKPWPEESLREVVRQAVRMKPR